MIGLPAAQIKLATPVPFDILPEICSRWGEVTKASSSAEAG